MGVDRLLGYTVLAIPFLLLAYILVREVQVRVLGKWLSKDSDERKGR